MAQYDLTQTVASYLDKHMIFPLLSFLKEKKIFPEEELLVAQAELACKTNMVAFTKECYEAQHKEIPAELLKKEENLMARMKKFHSICAPLITIFDNADLVKELQAKHNFTLPYLQQNHNVPKDFNIDFIYRYGKFLYESGKYSTAASLLRNYAALSQNYDKRFNALWGQFAAEILYALKEKKWENTIAALLALKEAIEAKTFSSQVQLLQQRSWFIHWSLFVFFHGSEGRQLIVSEVLQEERYLNAVQTTCPHILRYVVVAVLTIKRRKQVLNQLVKAIQQEAYRYRDPITEFVEDLYVNFDFDGAQQKLMECGEVLENDYFLEKFKNEFMENARLFIFETYCRIHQCIEIKMLAEKLNMEESVAERWIVNLIRNAQLDAKIDSVANHVVMKSQHPSIYKDVIEKTKVFTYKSVVLSSNVEKLATGGSTREYTKRK